MSDPAPHPAAFRPDVDTRTGEIVPVVPTALVVPVAPVPDVVGALEEFERVSRAILRRGDWQQAGQDGAFVVRSGWRRLSLAYGLSDELVDRIVERAVGGRFERVTTVLRVVAQNGRAVTGVGVASLKERCCADGCRKRHQHCRHDCDGVRHWTAADHSISATSFTRALSRGISDLVGGGPADDELPDEDTGDWDGGHDAGPSRGRVERLYGKRTATEVTLTAPSDEDDAPEYATPDPVTLGAQALQLRIADLDDEQVVEFDRIATERNLPLSPPTRAGIRAASQLLDEIEGSR